MARARLRTTLVIALGGLGVVILATAGAIFALTHLLDRATVSIGSAIESVRLAEEMEVDLLAYDRSGDSLTRASLARQMRRRLVDLEAFAGGPEELALLHRVGTSLERHEAARARGEQETRDSIDVVFGELEDLVALNVAEARAQEAHVKRWNRWANVGGLGMAILLIGGMGALVLWLPRHVLRPVLRISDSMARYGPGDRDVRAPESGPEELRAMARQFNSMASSLDRQRVNQLTFLAGVAHDLRSPLAALRMSSELLARADSLPPGQIPKMSGVVQRQTDRLERMVGDLLDAARIEAGELELRLEDCDVARIAEEVVELHRATAKSHQLVLQQAPRPVIVRADSTRLAQVLNNLVGNAIKYSPDGGMVTVEVGVSELGALVSVKDQGMGIAAEDTGRIFEPFQRVGAYRHELPGTGLGLSVVRKIVESHGGVIRVESRIGAGSTFLVELPVGAVGAESGASPPADQLH